MLFHRCTVDLMLILLFRLRFYFLLLCLSIYVCLSVCLFQCACVLFDSCVCVYLFYWFSVIEFEWLYSWLKCYWRYIPLLLLLLLPNRFRLSTIHMLSIYVICYNTVLWYSVCHHCQYHILFVRARYKHSYKYVHIWKWSQLNKNAKIPI